MSGKKIEKTLEKFIEEADEIFGDFMTRKDSKLLYEEALTMAKKVKKSLEVEYIQGKIDLIDEKWKDAVRHFDEAINMKADFVEAWNYKGNSLHNMAKYEEAVTCYNRAIEINPEFKLAWKNKGSSLHEIGRHAEAIECYEKALEIDPEDADAWNNKGYTLYEIRRYKEAIECYDRALEIDPGFWLAQNNRSLALTILGRFDEAKIEREKLYSEKRKKIKESMIADEEKEEIILEMDAQREVINELKDKYMDILEAKRTYEKNLADSLKPRDAPLSNNVFFVLRRWNSYTPVIPTTTESNVGGGYFLHWKGKGIAIDPGFDFVDNFFNNGFLIYDIDAVIITHSHVDHCSDFESLLTLIFEYNEKNDEKKRIDVFMNLGAMKKFLGWIPIDEDKNALIKRIYPLEKGISYNLKDYSLNLRITKAIHNEVLSKAYSVGIIFELYDNDTHTKDEPFKIGYTSDTRHDEHVENQYKGVDIIIPHLGSIDENDFSLEEMKRDKNHLMLKGVISTIYRSQAQLAIISEFGEELEEHRTTIVEALNRVFQENGMARCLTGDIGLNILLPDVKVACNYCKEEEKYVDFNDICEGIDPVDENKKCVVYYCRKCERTYNFLRKKGKKKKIE